MSGPPPPTPHGSKRLQDEAVGGGGSSGNHNSALGPSLKYPPPPPHVHDSSSGMGVGGGYPPPTTTTTAITTTSTTSNVVSPKLTTNDHYHSQSPFDQLPTGIHRQPQQQQQHPQPSPPPAQSSDRWSAMIPMYQQQHHQRTPPVDSHPAPLENRLECRGDYKGADKETTRGSSGGGADNKEVLKYDRDRDRGRDAYHPEIKVDDQKAKGYAGPGINWKESKDHYRVDTTKRYTNPTSGAAGNPDTWGSYFSNLHRPVQDGPSVEERDQVDPHEAVGENKIDLKSDDRYKEKDRKRKDLKARDWGGERDKERERRNNLQMQPGGGSGEVIKEPSAREEREADKWDREKKDLSKDTEKPKEREKDPVKRETWNGGPPEKDGLNSEKEPVVDMSGRTPERETSMLDQKKQKEHDGWKSADREVRERRKERDGDVDTERPEKRIRCYDKESDDGCAEPEGGSEKEREGFGYGVQQRKRMLRPRGSPQVGNRESRFRSRAQDNEGTQGKPEVSSVVYRVGECMQELMKLWKDYESSQADKNGENSQDAPTLEIRIPAEYITATNRQVRGGQLWGTDVYTGDSDLVAVLMHTGYCRPTASPPPPAIQELRATVKVLPPQDCYTSTLRNNVRSRAWGAAIGCSYCVERCCIFKKGGGAIDLEPCLTHTSTVEPTLAPVAVERTMTTRAAASNALRQQRFVREVTIQYNLCNEPWIKYSLSVVADKGLKKPLYTSARLKKGEVLYLETHSRRYELCFTGEKMVKPAISSETQDMDVDKSHSNNLHTTNGEREKSGLMDGDSVLVDVFRWSQCKRPLPLNLLRSSGIPLPSEHLEVLEENLDWEDIKWSQTGVFIAGKEYAFARLHFMSPN